MSGERRVWFVTGASKGIGLETVRAALEVGDRVVATSRRPGDFAGKIQKTDDFLAVEMTIPESVSIRHAVDQALDRFGRIDVLVNNAGYSLLGSVEELSDEAVRRNFDVNVMGVLAVQRAVLPVMREQRKGHVINLASISASVTGPATGIYSATKAAVLMLTEALAAELAVFGVHATAVCPGGVRTDFLDPSSSQGAEEATRSAYPQVRRAMAGYGRLNHNQGGDPRLVAEAFVQLTRMPDPPSRLYLGTDALQALRFKVEDVIDQANSHIALSQSIDGERG
ncbi:SDR family oxidoreductase [Hoyosella sp. YIM 151337]|uniref:SDR family oxidoreductase n=1 Tax=Hoyosella sp. YIM 151337 TaxID=2992742 RepID=UPI002235D2FA|nr:SDR family oxidoreductase [Hoyosella sp. YIM 151337]MCW4354532.1 SDR family oxidoreductase [Hoyosella sp. YIM 151337]